jgi:hypothetical protein
MGVLQEGVHRCWHLVRQRLGFVKLVFSACLQEHELVLQPEVVVMAWHEQFGSSFRGPFCSRVGKMQGICCPVCHERPCYAGTVAVMIPLDAVTLLGCSARCTRCGKSVGSLRALRSLSALPAKP